MNPIRSVYYGYRRVERHIRNMIAAQFFVQSINTAFFLLLNYYMARNGFADYEVAEVLSYRFLAVFCLAFPLGLLIKGRRLKPFFYAAAIGTPILSHIIILAIGHQWKEVLYAAATLWGLAYTCIQITALPYILLNARKETHSEAISMSFLSFSVTICLVGVANFLLNQLSPDFFTEKRVLQIVATLSMLGIFFVSRIRAPEQLSARVPLQRVIRGYDWGLIFRALIPTIIIAIGAGFTIPVINLFFLNVHGLPSKLFSLVGAFTFFLVAGVMLFMPYIRRRFGYRVAITLFQSAGVMALFVLSTTEYYREWGFAVYIAIAAYVIRQPLMNAAGPMTSELTMYYVGRRNQEIMSAMNASIWSGSWFISMKVFGWLRQMEFQYVSIFLITVAFYALGVAWYAHLIRAYERRQREEKRRWRAQEAPAVERVG